MCIACEKKMDQCDELVPPTCPFVVGHALIQLSHGVKVTPRLIHLYVCVIKGTVFICTKATDSKIHERGEKRS